MRERKIIEKLKEMKQMFNNLEIPFFVQGGPVLFMYRDKKVHTADIDLGILGEYYNIKKGEILREIRKTKDYKERYVGDYIAFISEDIDIDIWVFYKEGVYRICNFSSNRHVWDESLFENMEKIEIGGIELNAPSPIEEYLTQTFGNWRIPNPDWDYSKSPARARALLI